MINAKEARELTDTVLPDIVLASLNLDCLPFLEEQIQLAISKGKTTADINVIAEWSDMRNCHFIRSDDKIIKLSSVATALEMLGFKVGYDDHKRSTKNGLICDKRLVISWKSK